MKKRNIFLFVVLMIVFPMVILIGSLGCNTTPPGAKVTVTYNANGGKVSPLAEDVAVGDHVKLPLPTYGGYVFNGWYTAATGGTRVGGADDDFVVEDNVTLFAQWESGITVYYSVSGGVIAQNYETVLAGAIIKLPTTSKPGYAFHGWYSVKGVLVGFAGDNYLVDGGALDQGGSVITLIAEWRFNVTITFNANGGGVAPPQLAAPAGTDITLPPLVRDGYFFAGWYTAPVGGTRVGGAGGSYTIPITTTTNMTLYAQWSSGEVTVTYDTNGGDILLPKTVTAGTSVTLPQPTRSEKKFEGWYSAPGGTGSRVGGVGDSITVVQNITLYARWID
jgi:uncharacterized repeat protein (TIGR02543 family)